ncbi:protein phosphatase [Lithospermum erythrorhizon]|uniref:Protein phosphatase n=1 Tax=Lithospermum erythrorhizon TaxID=34254 RepID=A0AAV3PED5_LITER
MLQSLMRRSKEAMRKAHMYAKTKIQETNKAEETCKMGSASAIVINGEKLIIARMGEYSAVICKEGSNMFISILMCAYEHCLSSVLKRQRGRRINGPSANADGGNASNQTSEQLHVGSERIHSETEFVILANAGIWGVMQHQEAISLIRHLEHPQEAAECLANEALSRMSRRNISCLIIR